MNRTVSTAAAAMGLLSLLGTGEAKAQRIDFIDVRNHQSIGNGRAFPWDRIPRGNPVEVKISEPGNPLTYIQVHADNGFFQSGYYFLTFDWTFTVPLDPSFDNCTVDVYNYSTNRWVSRRLPIGRR